MSAIGSSEVIPTQFSITTKPGLSARCCFFPGDLARFFDADCSGGSDFTTGIGSRVVPRHCIMGSEHEYCTDKDPPEAEVAKTSGLIQGHRPMPRVLATFATLILLVFGGSSPVPAAFSSARVTSINCFIDITILS